MFLLAGGLAAGGAALTTITRLPADEPAAPPACAIPPAPEGKESIAPAYSFPPNPPVRVRKSFADLSPDELTDLASAYAQLKKGDDDLSWCGQANIHANHCVSHQYYLLVHDSWLFLPWHRAYLYFYESLLGQLLHKPAFALPYWDWTDNPTIPNAFFDAASPLYDRNRAPAKGQPISDDPETYLYTQQSFVDQLLGYPDFYSFGGHPGDQTSNQPGDLEQFPHNSVHTWVGTRQNPYIDMGNLATAARDLLFFLHHANIDRIWATWVQASGHSNPPDQSWLTQWFNFFDPQTGKVASVTVGDTVNGNMNVRYQAPQSLLALSTETQDLSSRRFTSGTADLTGTAVAKLLHPGATALALPTKPALKVRVLLEDVTSPRQQPVRIRVFLNAPTANAETPLTDPHFASSISLVPSLVPGEKHIHEHPPATLSIDVSRKLAELIRDDPANAKVSVTLVPVGLDKKLSDAKVEVKRITLKVTD
jgi:polyphenol oxidase